VSGVPSIDAHVTPSSTAERGALGPAVRGYLAGVRAHLAALQAAGAGGAAVNTANSDAHDRLIRRLYEVAESSHHAEEGLDSAPRFAVLAAGGYARREMSIASDVDLLFLVEDWEAGSFAERALETIQYALWDANVEVGAAMRTIDECIELGQRDETARTTLLGVRFLAGDAALLHALGRAVRERLIPDVAAFIDGQREAMARRRERFGDSLYLLQPNLKEGAGGLRDYHSAYWVARAAEPAVREVSDFLHAGLLTETEAAELHDALDFLWRTRNQLHLQAGRKLDQLSFEMQEQTARAFGYPDDGVGLPVERFMRDYYRHARVIGNLSEIVIEQCLARARPAPAPPATVPVEEGFRKAEQHLEIPHAAHLREKPVRLLLAFAVAQDHNVPLSRTARRLVRENLHLVDDAFRRDPAAAAAFVRILASPHRVMRTLMALNETGLLGRYLPEWDHIVCRWQHVIYHTYTVDVHSIFLVEELRRLWKGKYERALPDLTELVRGAADLPGLYLGCLLHDIGKGRHSGDHSLAGVELARGMVERLGLPPDMRERVLFIVRHHLTMSHVAHRRDLSDPKVIVEFARVVGDRQKLRDLYLATFADTRASSSTAWTEWRGELLRELYERTSEFLESGGDDPERAAALAVERVERRKEAARGELRALGVAEARIDQFFDMMPQRYFVSHAPKQIARHGLVLFSLRPGERLATSVRELRSELSEFIVWTQDQHGLFADVAGALTACGINIIGTHVYTTRTGLALEVYRVSSPPGAPEDRRERWERLGRVLDDVLAKRVRVAELIARQRSPVGKERPPLQTPPVVVVRNDVSDFYTVIDITADDRLGLLHDLTRTLSEQGLEIYVSKATTVLDQVADTFYVKGPDQKRLTDAKAIAKLREALLAAAAGGAASRAADAAAPGAAEDAAP
jgi:[protein-PII] uridylyltransferase